VEEGRGNVKVGVLNRWQGWDLGGLMGKGGGHRGFKQKEDLQCGASRYVGVGKGVTRQFCR